MYQLYYLSDDLPEPLLWGQDLTQQALDDEIEAIEHCQGRPYRLQAVNQDTGEIVDL